MRLNDLISEDSYNINMNFGTIQILVLLLIGVSAATVVSGTARFTNGYRQQFVEIPQLKRPLTLLSVEDLSYSAPFSLDLNNSIVRNRRGNFLIIQCLIGNSSMIIGRTYISVKYLVSPQLKGFELFSIRLHSAVPSRTLLPKAANSQKMKKGYFVTGFNSFSVLDRISIVTAPGNYFHAVLNSTNIYDWVEINFYVIDYSPVTGCMTHNSYDGSIDSLNGVTNGNFHFDDSETMETMLGLTNIKSISGRFEWDELEEGEVLAEGVGSFSFKILQIDTECAIEEAVKGTAQMIDYETNRIPITPIYPISPIIPIDNEIQDETAQQAINWPSDSDDAQISQTEINPIPPIIVPQPIVIPTNSSYSTNQNLTPITPQQPLTEQQLNPKRQQSSQKITHGNSAQPLPTSISAWKILGFVFLSWVVISILAIPLLCCLLWRSRKRLEQQDEIIKRYANQNEQKISQPVDDIIVKETDVRLFNYASSPPIEMKEIVPRVEQRIVYRKHSSIQESRDNKTDSEPEFIEPRKISIIKQPVVGERSRYASEIHPTESSLKYSKSDVKNPYSEIKNNSQIAENQLQEIDGSPSVIRDQPLTFKQNKSRFDDGHIHQVRNDESIPTLIEYEKQSNANNEPVQEKITYEDKSEGSNEPEEVPKPSVESSPAVSIKRRQSSDEVTENVGADRESQTKNSEINEQHNKSHESVKLSESDDKEKDQKQNKEETIKYYRDEDKDKNESKDENQDQNNLQNKEADTRE